MRNAIVFLTATLAVAAAGCKTTQPKTEPMPVVAAPPDAGAAVAKAPEPAVLDDGKAVDVSLKVEAVTPKGQAFVDSGGTLHTGDKIALHVGVNAPAYVYVALASADGSQSLLFPPEGAKADAAVMKPGGDQRVPALTDKWYRLDKTTGFEDIYVYASKKALTKDDVLGRVVADNKKPRKPATKTPGTTTRKPRPKATPHGGDGVGHTTGTVVAANDDAPVASTDDTRGLDLVDDATTSADQVTRKHFTITHAK
jgi:hypothetical protein